MAHKFPENWKAYKLDQLGLVGRGRSRHRPRNEPSLYGGEYPFFQTGDIKAANLYLVDYTQTYNEKGLAQSKLWDPETLCITIAANIADTAILGIRGCFPDSVIGFMPDKKVADVRFIKYYIDMKKLDMQQVSHGTTQDNLSLDKLLRFDFIIPLVDEQRKIAAILSAYDDLIENNLRRIKILEEMAQNLYREWFVNFRFPGHEQTRFVDSPLGRIPDGWEETVLKDMARVITGYAFKSKDWVDSGIPVIKIKNIRPGNKVDTENTDRITEVSSKKIDDRYWLQNGDYLIAMTGATAGKIGKLRSKVPMLLNQRVAKIKPKKIFSEYIWCSIRPPDAEKTFYALADGAAQPNMSGEQIENYRLIKPVEKIIIEFNSMVYQMISLVDKLYFQNQNLRQTRDLLLPKLISGEVDVSELDIKVPEEVAS